MKALTISLSLIACLRLQICGSDDEAPPLTETAEKSAESAEAPPSPPTAAASAPEARHGGTVVVAGEYPVEVVPHASGEVHAHILSTTPPTSKLEIRVEVPVKGRPPQPLTLLWNAQLGRYEGRVRDVVIVPGALVVHVNAGPQVWIGRAATIVIAPAVVVEVHDHHDHHEHKKHKKHKKHKHH